jgi:hypothetical protein
VQQTKQTESRATINRLKDEEIRTPTFFYFLKTWQTEGLFHPMPSSSTLDINRKYFSPVSASRQHSGKEYSREVRQPKVETRLCFLQLYVNYLTTMYCSFLVCTTDHFKLFGRIKYDKICMHKWNE